MSYQSTVQSFELADRSTALANAKVINKEDIEYYVYFHIPTKFASHSILVDMYKLDDEPEAVDYVDLASRDCMRPWIRMPSKLLDTNSGHHLYKLVFINKKTDDIFSFFVSYIIQDDNPDKPYIYMNREEDGGCVLSNICNICK